MGTGWAQLRDLLLQPGRLGRARQRWLLPIGAVELLQIAGDTLLDLRHAPFHLRACEVLVTVVDRLGLAAIDRDAGFGEQAHGATERNKPGTDLPEWPWLFSVNSLHGSIAVAGVDGSVSAGRVPIVAGVLPPIIDVPLLGFGADIRVTCCRISDRLLARRRRERRRRWQGSFLRWRICAFICWRVVTLYEGDVGAVRNHYLDIGYVRGRTYDRLRVEIPGTVHLPPPAIPAVAHCII